MLRPDHPSTSRPNSATASPGVRAQPQLSAELKFLYDRINYERKSEAAYPKHFKLETMRRLLGDIGDPQLAYRIVHVAGTKGKGSVCKMIAMGLDESGVSTGVYSSPHLQLINERIVIRGRMIDDQQLAGTLAHVRQAVERLDRAIKAGERRCSFFEMITAAALWCFAQMELEMVVLEVGLGGRLDSTNVCQPELCLVTNISIDHTRQLGKRVDRIAREKAGIIKPGIPVISGVRDPLALREIRETCAVSDSPLYELGTDFDVETLEIRPSTLRQTVRVHGAVGDQRFDMNHIDLPGLGRHQSENAALAVAALQWLSREDSRIDTAAIRRAIGAFKMIGRFELLARAPLILLDMAHNVASIQALVETIQNLREDRTFQSRPETQAARRFLIFASSQDKDVAGMLQQILPEFEHVITTKFVENPRAMPPREIAELCPATTAVTIAETPADAWRSVARQLSLHDEVCVTGSAFLIAEMRPIIQDWLVSATVAFSATADRE